MIIPFQLIPLDEKSFIPSFCYTILDYLKLKASFYVPTTSRCFAGFAFAVS
jgi:hypothetical protein